MKKLFLIIPLLVIILTFYSCSAGSMETERQQAVEDTEEYETEEITETTPGEKQEEGENIRKIYNKYIYIPAPSVANHNMFKEYENEEASVVLPPGYYDSDKRYPTLYYLHGFNSSIYSLGSIYSNIREKMESGELEEFILVCASGKNRLQGSFYVNSPVTGNWEDFIVKDVVGYIDNNFRTIADPEARGLAGFSMGGFGAINIALKHPDTFSYVYALSPMLFDENGLEKAFKNNDLNIIFKRAYGAAFSHNKELPMPYAEIPAFDGSEKDNEIITNWKKGFGNLEDKINNYINKDGKLEAILIEYGKEDSYEWVPEGCRYFSGLLNDKGIDHELVELDGGHELDFEILLEDMMPFFSDNF